jgi:sulfate adenylyltransferase
MVYHLPAAVLIKPRVSRLSNVATTERKLQTPHGGHLVDLLVAEDAKAEAIASCTKTIELSDRNACDVELLTVGCV